jgi:hypothetical protein
MVERWTLETRQGSTNFGSAEAALDHIRRQIQELLRREGLADAVLRDGDGHRYDIAVHMTMEPRE